MRFYWLVLIAGFLLLSLSVAEAEEASESGSLPPEKTRIIYETLLPAGLGNRTSPEPQGEVPPQPAVDGARMTGDTMAEILRQRNIALQGESGHWQFLHNGIQFFLLVDAEHNRMRLMAPLARLDAFRQDADFSEVDLLQRMLRANYLATGDVRLCLNKHVLWAAFLHPLDSLTKRDFLSALDQTATVAQQIRGGAG